MYSLPKFLSKQCFLVAGITLSLSLAALPAAGTTVYEQPLDPNGDLYASQNDTAPGGVGDFAKAYDNFSLASTTPITDVHWFGGYFNPGPPGAIENFLIQFWADNAGQPDGLLFSATVPGNAGEMNTGIGPWPFYEYWVG